MIFYLATSSSHRPPQLEWCVRIGGLPQEKTIKGFTVWFWLFFSDFYTFKNWWACLPPFLRGTSNTNNSILQVFCTFQLTYPTTTRVCVCVCVWQANYHVLLYHFLNFTIITHIKCVVGVGVVERTPLLLFCFTQQL